MLTEWTPRNSRPEADANILYVVIGRNIGAEPMSEDDWDEFQYDVMGILEDYAGKPDFVVVGKGGGWDGATEESAVFTVLNPKADEESVRRTKRALGVVKYVYRQDAIAVTYGTSTLV